MCDPACVSVRGHFLIEVNHVVAEGTPALGGHALTHTRSGQGPSHRTAGLLCPRVSVGVSKTGEIPQLPAGGMFGVAAVNRPRGCRKGCELSREGCRGTPCAPGALAGIRELPVCL